jgi:hypothetical protein
VASLPCSGTFAVLLFDEPCGGWPPSPPPPSIEGALQFGDGGVGAAVGVPAGDVAAPATPPLGVALPLDDGVLLPDALGVVAVPLDDGVLLPDALGVVAVPLEDGVLLPDALRVVAVPLDDGVLLPDALGVTAAPPTPPGADDALGVPEGCTPADVCGASETIESV